MTLHRRYEPATRCTGGPTPGAKALMGWFLGAYGHLGGKNLGIYNCRSVAGSSTTSLHGEGRACDFGINPHGASWGTGLAELLRARSGELGIQCIIWNRQIWSAAYPEAGWRRYSGKSPHLDHIHLELSKHAAATLTSRRVQEVLLAPRNPPRPPAVAPAKAPPPPPPAPQRPREDNCMFIKTQPDKTKPGILTALLSGPMFVALGASETPSDEQLARMGVPVLWVEFGTWQEFDRRSHALCDRPMQVVMQEPSSLRPPSSGPTSAPNSPSPSR